MSTLVAPPPDAQAADPRQGWTALARLLEYPGADFASRMTEAARVLPRLGEAPALAWERFRAALEPMTPEEREELYTATFDVRPACIPYVSIHLFGEENFQRGQFMAALLERYRRCGWPTEGELPDHLAVLLRFAAQTEDGEQRELAQFCLLGPLRRMQEALADEHPYRALLEAVEAVILNTHPGIQAAPCPVSATQKHHTGGCSCSASFLAGIASAGCPQEEETL